MRFNRTILAVAAGASLLAPAAAFAQDWRDQGDQQRYEQRDRNHDDQGRYGRDGERDRGNYGRDEGRRHDWRGEGRYDRGDSYRGYSRYDRQRQYCRMGVFYRRDSYCARHGYRVDRRW